MTELSYKIYTEKNLAVYDPQKLHTDLLKKYGRFYKNLRDGSSAWLIPKENEHVIKKLCEPQTMAPVVESSTRQIDEMEKHAKPRQEQTKYRRAKSKSRENTPPPHPLDYNKFTKYIKTPDNSITSLDESESESESEVGYESREKSPDSDRREKYREKTPDRREKYREKSPDRREKYREKTERRKENRGSPTRDIRAEMKYLQDRLLQMEKKLRK